MPEWIALPTAPLRYQPVQHKFLEDRRARLCQGCRIEFNVLVNPICPQCKSKGVRKFDRLTIIAGRRFGKTRIGSIAACEEATVDNSIGWACAPTNDKLNRYIIPAFQEIITPEMVRSYNSEYHDLRLKNGALIHFQTLEHPDQGRGQGLDWLWVDEICELTKKHWEVIRPSLAGDTAAFFTTSPRGYDWVYENLVVPAENNIPGFWAAKARTIESANPKISPEFLARERATMTPTMYAQEYEADFVVFTGAIYGNLMDSQILRTDESIRKVIPEWPNIESWRQIIIGIDTGADHPFGACKLVSTEHGLVVVGEYLDRDKTFIQHCNNLKRLATHRISGPPQVKWAINKNERQPSIELAQHGIFAQKSENDFVAGTERVKSWLYAKELWFVESACPNTLNQMRAYRYAENVSPKDEQKKVTEKPFKKNDELPDCIRYALMTWPKLPSGPPEQKPKQRDLSKLPPEYRATIELMRRFDAHEKFLETKQANVIQEYSISDLDRMDQEYSNRKNPNKVADDFWS
jgi:hypothetical protein